MMELFFKQHLFSAFLIVLKFNIDLALRLR